jgi:hypothetical protein
LVFTAQNEAWGRYRMGWEGLNGNQDHEFGRA